MTEHETVALLNALEGGDPEADHLRADDYLLSYLLDLGYGQLVEAYQQARDRCRFWYA